MSLINKVLKELDRQDGTKSSDDLSAMRAVTQVVEEPSEPSRWPSLRLPALAFLFVAFVVLGITWRDHQPTSTKAIPDGLPSASAPSPLVNPPVSLPGDASKPTAEAEAVALVARPTEPAVLAIDADVSPAPAPAPATSLVGAVASIEPRSIVPLPAVIRVPAPTPTALASSTTAVSLGTVRASPENQRSAAPSALSIRGDVPLALPFSGALSPNPGNGPVDGKASTSAAPVKAESRWAAAVQLIQTNKNTEAETLLRQIIEEDPQHWRARQALAGLLSRARRAAEAADLLADGLMLAPQQRSLRPALAQLWSQMGQMNEALALMDDGAPAATKDPAYLLAYAQLLIRAKRPAEAVPWFNAVLALSPKDPGALIGLGLAKRALGDNDAALENLRRSLASPTISAAQRELAESRIRDISGIGVAR